MKRITLTFVFIIFSYANSFAQKTHSITVDFTGMKSNKGNLLVALYNTEKSFLKEPYKTIKSKIDSLKSKVVFKDIPAGEYAISAFHDENDNQKMDVNFFGAPKEAIGTSNDAKGFMGPPKYKDAKFIVKDNVALKISVVSIF